MKIEISGAKNISLALLPSAFFAKEMYFFNLPNIEDINIQIQIMKSIGLSVIQNKNAIGFRLSPLINNVVPCELGSKIRASLYFLGALLGNGRDVIIPHPGGCNASERKIDMHISSLRFLGAEVIVNGKYIYAKKNKLMAKRIRLSVPSKGVTINIIYMALLLPGKTIIENASVVPEIRHLVEVLFKIGYDVSIIDHDVIIEGKPNHNYRRGEYRIPFDRIEAGTFAVLALLLRKELTIVGVDSKDSNELCSFLNAINAQYIFENKKLHILSQQRLKSATVYLGFPPAIDSDYGPIIAPLLCLIKGNSILVDNHNTHRINNILKQLGLLGAKYRALSENVFLIHGVREFKGNCELVGSEIRGTMGLALAALTARGNISVVGLEHINRAYEDFVGKISVLGMNLDIK